MIRLNNIYKLYGEKNILNDLNLTIKANDYISIIGKSGSGKSTLLNILGLIDKQDKGSYQLNEKDLKNIKQNDIYKIRNQKIGFVFQSYYLIPHLSVYDNIILPCLYSTIKTNAYNKSKELIESLNLNEIINTKAKFLSGGEKQRVAIARALIQNPEIIICDEPTGNLDNNNTTLVMDILENLNKQGKTIIIVTHDLSVAKRSKIIYQLNQGKVEKYEI